MVLVYKNNEKLFTEKESDDFIDKVIALIEQEDCHTYGKCTPNLKTDSKGKLL